MLRTDRPRLLSGRALPALSALLLRDRSPLLRDRGIFSEKGLFQRLAMRHEPGESSQCFLSRVLSSPRLVHLFAQCERCISSPSASLSFSQNPNLSTNEPCLLAKAPKGLFCEQRLVVCG